MTLSRPLLDELLARWPVATLTTVTSTGRPHAVPIVFCPMGAVLYSPIDGKRKRGGELKRVANVRAHPAFSLLLDAYHRDWQRLWWVRLDGSAEVVAPDAAQTDELAARFRQKYPQYRSVALSAREPRFLRLAWEKTTAWAEGDVSELVAAELAELPARW